MAVADDNLGKNHVQLRLPTELRTEISEVAGRLGVTTNDVVRGALHFGLPVFAAMTGVQDEMVKRLVQALKERSRADKPKKKKSRTGGRRRRPCMGDTTGVR